MIILLHTSKTMASPPRGDTPLRRPLLWKKASELNSILKTLSLQELTKIMKISPPLAKKTYDLIDAWTTSEAKQSLAIDSFIGDIYSGLRVEDFSQEDRNYADETLFILSGLYGILRPLDGIFPYRLEMGYKFSGTTFENLYQFWGDTIAECLPKNGPIVNLASEEFSKTVLPFVDKNRVVVPKFLTMNVKTEKPTFVTIHSKITRGAFAHWLIINRIEEVEDLKKFKDLGYRFDQKLSQPNHPTFVCEEFGGKGLSIKLKGK